MGVASWGAAAGGGARFEPAQACASVAKFRLHTAPPRGASPHPRLLVCAPSPPPHPTPTTHPPHPQPRCKASPVPGGNSPRLPYSHLLLSTTPPVQGFLTGLGGNSLLLSYFAAKQETNAVVVQALGVASSFAVLTQICAAGHMPRVALAALAVVVALQVGARRRCSRCCCRGFVCAAAAAAAVIAGMRGHPLLLTFPDLSCPLFPPCPRPS